MEDIDTSVMVTIQYRMTAWALPLPLGEGEFAPAKNVATARAGLGRWEPSVYFNQLLAIPSCFIGQHSDKLRP